MSSTEKTAAETSSREVTPRLRFPEFRDEPAWMGTQLGAIAAVNPQNKGLPKSFVYVDLESVVSGTLTARKQILREEAPSRAQRPLMPGDVLFQMVRPYQRNNLLFDFGGDEEFVASTGYAQLRAYGSRRFLYHLVHTDPFVGNVVKACTGSSYPAINSSDLAAIDVLVPESVLEQQKIGDCLSSLDEVIAAQVRKVEGLNAHKRGLMQRLFPREGETVPRLRFPEFRSAPGWEMKKLGALLLETSRPIALEDDKDYSLVTVKRRYGGVVSRSILQGKVIKVQSQFLVKAEDFLISKRQIVHNACGLVPKDLEGSVVSNEYSVMTPKEGCDIRFFNYFSQQPAVSDSFLQSSVGIVIEKMLFKLDWWLDREFLFPTIHEQRRIATCLASVESQITAETRKLDVLRTHKHGLMQQLFPLPGEPAA